MVDTAGATITATFDSRRKADLAVEQLVQEHGIERADIFVAPEGDENSSGEEIDGADAESGHPEFEAEGDPALAGAITVSVDLADDEKLEDVRQTLEDHGGEDIAAE